MAVKPDPHEIRMLAAFIGTILLLTLMVVASYVLAPA